MPGMSLHCVVWEGGHRQGSETTRPPIWIGEIESHEVMVRYHPHDDPDRAIAHQAQAQE